MMANPFAFAFSGTQNYVNGTITFIQCGVTYSGPTYVGSAFSTQQITVPIGGVNTATSNSQYVLGSSGSVPLNVQVRIVGFGLRVRNTTPYMNRGGNLYGAETVNHEDIGGAGNGNLFAYNVSTLNLLDTSSPLSATSNSWHSVTWHPQDDDEFDFNAPRANNYVVTNGNDDALIFNSTLGFIAVAPSATPQSYEYEAWGIYEAKGINTRGVTPSASDPIGMAAVQNASSSVAMRKPHTGDRLARVSRVIGQVGGMMSNAYSAYQSVRNPMRMLTASTNRLMIEG